MGYVFKSAKPASSGFISVNICLSEMNSWIHFQGNDSNLLIVFYVQIMPDD
ncbi:enhanced serine sensitivity protein SseB, partial [Shigella flexneri]